MREQLAVVVSIVVAATFVLDNTNVRAQAPAASPSSMEEQQSRVVRLNALLRQRRWGDGLVLAESLLKLQEQQFGRDSLEVAQTLEVRGVCQLMSGLAADAIASQQRALYIAEKLFGSDHQTSASYRVHLCTLYREAGKAGDAVSCYKRTLAIKERALGTDHPEVAEILGNLGMALDITGDYAQALSVMERALWIRERAIGERSLEVALSLNNLAVMFDKLGDYERAIETYLRTLAIKEQHLGPNDAAVALSLSNLAMAYHHRGDDVRAEPLLKRARAILEKDQARGPVDFGKVTSNLAEVRQAKGDYKQAESLRAEAVEILTRTLGPSHPDVATALNNWAQTQMQKADYQSATALLERALRIWEGALGPEHPEVANVLNNLAEAYRQTPEHARAHPLLERAVAIREKALGPEHPSLAQPLDNLASSFFERTELARAQQLSERSVHIREMAFGPEHPALASGLNGLAITLAAQGKLAAAMQAKTRASDVRERALTYVLADGAEEQKLQYWASVHDALDSNLSLHLRLAPSSQDAARLAFTTLLRRKGRVLDVMTDTLRVLHRRAGPEDRRSLEELARIRGRLAAQTLRGPSRGDTPTAHTLRLSQLREAASQLEATLAARYLDLKIATDPPTLEAVQSALGPQTALVEIATYRPFNFVPERDRRWEPARYVAYVIRPGAEIVGVDLGDAEHVERLALEAHRALATLDPSFADIARQLDEVVMRPIRPWLGDVRDLFVAPDGALNLIPFDALVDEQDQFLVAHYRITYLATGRELPRLGLSQPARDPALILAAPNYDAQLTEAQKAPHDAAARPAAASGNSLHFSALDTVDEGRRVAEYLTRARLLTGQDATEGALKLARGPQVLHVATHGFFLGEAEPRAVDPAPMDDEHMNPTRGMRWARESRSDGPLLRSGVALAGANRGLVGDQDGVLTALEAASLDLWGTKSVTLSACETALGNVRNGDGVYGLRRALVLAGSETQILSLWKVDSDATRDLMVAYYYRLRGGAPRSDAMREVELAMLSTPGRAHPFFWAAFIVSGNPRSLTQEEASAVREPHGIIRAHEAMRDLQPPRSTTAARTSARGCGCSAIRAQGSSRSHWLTLPFALLTILCRRARRAPR